jgi:hypothetical protein
MVQAIEHGQSTIDDEDAKSEAILPGHRATPIRMNMIEDGRIRSADMV